MGLGSGNRKNPITDPGSKIENLKKIYSWKFIFYFLDQKLQLTYP